MVLAGGRWGSGTYRGYMRPPAGGGHRLLFHVVCIDYPCGAPPGQAAARRRTPPRARRQCRPRPACCGITYWAAVPSAQRRLLAAGGDRRCRVARPHVTRAPRAESRAGSAAMGAQGGARST